MKRLYSFLILIGLINANLLIEIPQALGSRIEKVYMPSKKDSLSNLGAKFVFDPTFHQRAKSVDDSRFSSSKKNIADTRVLNSRSKQSNSMVLLVKDRGTGKPIDNTLVVLKLYETDTYTEYKTDDLGEISIPLTFSDSLVHISIAASGYVSIPECTIPVWDTAHLEVILQPLQLSFG